MRILLTTGLSLLMCGNTFALGQVSCPSTLVCNGDTGVCRTDSEWVLDLSDAIDQFSGQQELKLSKIHAYKQGSDPNDTYQFTCTYNYGQSTSSRISLYTYVTKLEGNWVYSGFGKQQATCQNLDPKSCTGSNW